MATASDPAIRNQQKLLWTAVHRAFLALFGLGGFVHVLLALFNPDGYRDFSDSALFSWVHDGW